MTKEELSYRLLSWTPEIIFATEKGFTLLLEIDAFNNHMFWEIKWHQGGYDCYKEFDDFVEARDYFLKKVHEYI